MDKKKRLLTGDRPTGKLHLGHYVGSLANRVKLQHQYDCWFLIADYHALTTQYEKDTIAQISGNIRELILDMVSAGIEPGASHYYIQSDVPEVCELALLLGMIVPTPMLERVPTLKEIIRDLNIPNPSYGLLGYPVLQAADILFVRGEVVPVGKDQEAHLELTREIVRRFNRLYGEVFPEPQSLLSEVSTLVGLDGKAKMSKSLDNCIYLSDPPEVVQKKVGSMYTDPTRLRASDPGHVEGNPVFMYHDAFNPNKAEVQDLKDRYEKGKVGDVEVKKKLTIALNQFLDPIRERRAKYEKEFPSLLEWVKESGKAAREEARRTLALVKEAMGFHYHI